MNTTTTFFRTCRQRTVRGCAVQNQVAATSNITRTTTTAGQCQRRALSITTPRKSQSGNEESSSITSSRTSTSLPNIVTSKTETKALDSEHSTSSCLTSTKSPPPPRTNDATTQTPSFIGHVTRIGTMRKTVRTTRYIQIWDRYLQKTYTRPQHFLVHDPEEILLEGDVIRYGAFPAAEAQKRREQRLRSADRKNVKTGVKWVLREVVTPFGVPVEERASRAGVMVEREREAVEVNRKGSAGQQLGGSAKQRRLRAN